MPSICLHDVSLVCRARDQRDNNKKMKRLKRKDFFFFFNEMRTVKRNDNLSRSVMDDMNGAVLES